MVSYVLEEVVVVCVSSKGTLPFPRVYDPSVLIPTTVDG